LFNPAEQRFVSRDLNAALNIRRIHLGLAPVILSRRAADGRLEQSIVKRLKDR
jgi:transposase